jgi:uncharacterized protein
VIVDTPARHEQLVQALLDPAAWPDAGGDRVRIDTHVSTVVLAGGFAYKLKKPVDLGFLDFLSLEAREAACREELRLNGRLAPDLYLDVLRITGDLSAPRIDGPGETIDWAVKMCRFDPDAILSQRVGSIDDAMTGRLARQVADFHATAEVAPPDTAYGRLEVIATPVQQNFAQLRAPGDRLSGPLGALERWSLAQLEELSAEFVQRRRDGRVRECHGDLHLGNIALIDGETVIFDAIEFSPELRWIDTINDAAFLLMDLHHRASKRQAFRFLDLYLQASGDYAGLALLRHYMVYRALVRAKIAAIRASQGDDGGQSLAEVEAYVALAGRLTARHPGALVITHGVSGSGKSHAAMALPGPLPAVCLRSDVERKRLLGIAPADNATALGGYSAELTARTYARLAELAAATIAAGYVAVVDATFLDRAQRGRFAALAARLDVPFVILDCSAPVDVLRERIQRRRGQSGNVSDAGLAVLESQLAAREPLSGSERGAAVPAGVGDGLDVAAVVARVDQRA